MDGVAIIFTACAVLAWTIWELGSWTVQLFRETFGD